MGPGELGVDKLTGIGVLDDKVDEELDVFSETNVDKGGTEGGRTGQNLCCTK